MEPAHGHEMARRIVLHKVRTPMEVQEVEQIQEHDEVVLVEAVMSALHGVVPPRFAEVRPQLGIEPEFEHTAPSTCRIRLTH